MLLPLLPLLKLLLRQQAHSLQDCIWPKDEPVHGRNWTLHTTCQKPLQQKHKWANHQFPARFKLMAAMHSHADYQVCQSPVQLIAQCPS